MVHYECYCNAIMHAHFDPTYEVHVAAPMINLIGCSMDYGYSFTVRCCSLGMFSLVHVA